MKAPTFLLLIFPALFSGCTHLPNLSFAPNGITTSKIHLDAALLSVKVEEAWRSEQTGNVDISVNYDSERVPELWQTALRDALEESKIFTDYSVIKTNVHVKILEFDMPQIGVTMKTRITAVYEVEDNFSRKIIYKKKISSVGTCPLSYSLIADARIAESANLAVKDSILQFIKALQEIH